MGLRESWPQHRPYTTVEEAFAGALLRKLNNETTRLSLDGVEEVTDLKPSQISAAGFARKHRLSEVNLHSYCAYHRAELGVVRVGKRYFYDEAKLLEAYTNRKKRRPTLYSQG